MVESNYSAKGKDFMKAGDKKMKGSFFGNVFGSKGERAEEALEQYKNAATNFKLAKMWEDASQAYIRCADCEKMAGSGDQAEYYVEASNMLRKVNSADAIKYLDLAIELYCEQNRISYAARLKKQIAELYESDFELILAAKYYSEAAELYYAENERSSDYSNMRLKVADLSVQQPDCNYAESIEIYESVGDKYLENKLTEPSAKNLYFKAALLYLANEDSVGCAMAIEKYCDKSPSFQNTRQQKFLSALVQAVESNNLEAFSTECFNFNQIIPLDKWQTSVLSKIKEKLDSSKQVKNNNDDTDDINNKIL